MNNNGSKLFWGMILILFGVIFLLNRTGHIDWDIGYIISTFWPVILIAYGLKGLLDFGRSKGDYSSSMLWGLITLVLGGFFLARNLNIIHMSFGDLFSFAIPIVLIVAGLSLIFKRRGQPAPASPHHQASHHQASYEQEAFDDERFDHQERSAYGSKKTVHKSAFIGDIDMGSQGYWELSPLNLSSFIGDTVIDLTKAQIPYGETSIVVSSFIGDIKVFVPYDIELELSVECHTFAGDSLVFDRKEGGLFSSFHIEPADYQIAEKRIKLKVNQFIGDLKIQRIG